MRTRTLGITAALALVLAACSSGTEAATTTSTEPPTTLTTLATPETTTTTLPPTTTTTIPPVEVFDTINGLERLDDEELGVLAIKIDNHPNARPHTGLQYADVVWELPVEAGLTRYIAMYDRYQLEKVGPVRSLRPTDPAIVNPIEVPLQVSGGSNWVLREVRASGTHLLTDNGNGTYRDNSRSAPHNLYADTTQLRERVDELGWGLALPGNLFSFGTADALGMDVSSITIPFSSQPPAVWEWDATTEQYAQSYGDTPHTSFDIDGEEQQVVADVLIVIMADQYTARPPKPSDGKAVPAMDLIGSGDALILYDGQMSEVYWERPATEDFIAITHEDGTPVTFEPGIVWVSIVPTSQTVTWE